MQPETGTAVKQDEVQPEKWEVELAEKAASRLTESLPHKTHQEIVDDLLRCLLAEKAARRLQNLDHWPDYAPGYLDKLVRSLANEEAWRRRKIAAFFKREYKKACAFAGAFLTSPEEIEDAVGEAFLRLQAGRSGFKCFYRTLKQIVVDRLREMEDERKLFVSLEAMIEAYQRYDEGLESELPAGSSEPHRASCSQDPVEVLMDRRKRRAKPLMVGRAKKSPKMRRVRRSEWTKELENPRPK